MLVSEAPRNSTHSTEKAFYARATRRSSRDSRCPSATSYPAYPQTPARRVVFTNSSDLCRQLTLRQLQTNTSKRICHYSQPTPSGSYTSPKFNWRQPVTTQSEEVNDRYGPWALVTFPEQPKADQLERVVTDLDPRGRTVRQFRPGTSWEELTRHHQAPSSPAVTASPSQVDCVNHGELKLVEPAFPPSLPPIKFLDEDEEEAVTEPTKEEEDTILKSPAKAASEPDSRPRTRSTSSSRRHQCSSCQTGLEAARFLRRASAQIRKNPSPAKVYAYILTAN